MLSKLIRAANLLSMIMNEVRASDMSNRFRDGSNPSSKFALSLTQQLAKKEAMWSNVPQSSNEAKVRYVKVECDQLEQYRVKVVEYGTSKQYTDA